MMEEKILFLEVAGGRVPYTLRDDKPGFNPSDYDVFLLGVDVGGTNTDLGVSGIINGAPELVFSLHFKSNDLDSLSPAVSECIRVGKDFFGIMIKKACIGAAGPVSIDYSNCKPTNLNWSINIHDLVAETPLESAFILNDFEAIGYGINFIDLENPSDVFKIKHPVHQHKPELHAPKVIVGAGTGFGKTILIWMDCYKAYVTIPSEGGHADFPATNQMELKLIEYIKNEYGVSTVSINEVVTGRGLESIYAYLNSMDGYSETEAHREIMTATSKAEHISQHRKSDPLCRETFRLFTIFYARVARNIVMDALARGGLYIAGGIASKNREIFESEDFIREYESSNRLAEVLEKIPIYIITNYDVSLTGAAFAAHIRNDLMITK